MSKKTPPRIQYRDFTIEFDPDPWAEKYQTQWMYWETACGEEDTRYASSVKDAKAEIDEILVDRLLNTI
jgi:hypothetical protein